MSFTLTDIILCIVIFALIGVAWYLVEDARKKGYRVVGRGCGGAPCNRLNDGTYKDDAVVGREATAEDIERLSLKPKTK